MHPFRSVAAATVVVVAASCSGGDSTADTTRSTESPTTTTSTTTTVDPATTLAAATTTTSSSTTTTTTLPPIPRQPLTGEVRADGEEIIDRPALVVKIDNAGPARRNHSGLAAADIVFEEIVEADITRFAAVFHSRGSDPVGPIRSGRSQDVDLVTSFGRPLFAWSGGNPGVTALIAAAPLVDLNWQGSGRGYYRGAGPSPHDVYNDTATLWAQTPDDHPGPPPKQFAYLRPGGRFRGEPTAGLRLAMRSIDVEWTWDAESDRFLRSQEGAAHVDQVNGRIGAENVVVMVVEYRPSQIDARSPEAQTIGSGPVVVFSDGQSVAGRWRRASAAEPIRLETEEGRHIALTPGTTWIELAEAIESGDPARPDVALEILPPA